QFLENPFESVPRARDSGGSWLPRLPATRMLPSANTTASASATSRFRSCILAARVLAVYASLPPVTRRKARLATGLPATALAGLDFHQLDSFRKVSSAYWNPPSPSFAWRDKFPTFPKFLYVAP